MAIIMRLDVMLAKRKVRSNVLAEAIGITESNLSLLKSGKVTRRALRDTRGHLPVPPMPARRPARVRSGCQRIRLAQSGVERRIVATDAQSAGGLMSVERRALLSFLAASPLCAALAPWTRVLADKRLPASAADALDVFELEAIAQRLVPAAHWGYLQSGRVRHW